MTALTKGLFATAATALVTLSAASPALAQDGRWYGDRDSGRHDRHGWQGASNPRDAVRQCSRAAERGASRHGRADVTRINDVDRTGRGFVVRGRLVVDKADGWRNGWNRDRRNNDRWDRDAGSFRCRVEYGRVVDLDIDGIGRY